MSLGFFDSVKDWASKKLASSEFVTYVEQATNESLLSPNYDMYMVLVDAANDPKGEWVSDVVRSVRIRMDHPNPKVKLFTLELVSVLVQNCGLKFHSEMAQSKGLLSTIIETACLRQDLVRGPLAEARKSAIQLIVNLDVWFKHHPAADKVQTLAKMIDDAKARNCVFENVIPDTTTQIITEKYPRRGQQQQQQQQQGHTQGVPRSNRMEGNPDNYVPNSASRVSAAGGGGSSYPGVDRQRMRPVRDEIIIVEAIPVEEPNDEKRAGMFEAVMLLGECLHAAQQSKNANIRADEMIMGIAQQVQEDFLNVSMLVNSGAVLQTAETLGSLYESQRTVLRAVREGGAGDLGNFTPPAPRAPQTTSAASSSSSGTASAAVPSSQQPVVARPTTTAPPKKAMAPSLDELFAQSAPVPASSSLASSSAAANNNNSNNNAANLAMQGIFSPVTQQPAAAASNNNNNTNTLAPPAPATGTVRVSGDGTPGTARRSALPEPRQNLQHKQSNTGFDKPVEYEMLDQELHSPKEGGGDSDPSPTSTSSSSSSTTQLIKPQDKEGEEQELQSQPANKPAEASQQQKQQQSGGTRTAADIDDSGPGSGEQDFDAFLNARLSVNAEN